MIMRMEKQYFVHESAYVDDSCTVGTGTRIWHFSHLMSHSIIGDHCTIGQNVMIASHAVLGDRVKVQNNVSIYEGVICEDDVFLGPSMVFTNVLNPRSAISRKHEFQTTLVKKGATIGANATVLCGLTIGEYAFVGAGSVVTKDVAAYALVLGNPARQKGWVSESGQQLIFGPGKSATCPQTGEQYVMEDKQVRKLG